MTSADNTVLGLEPYTLPENTPSELAELTVSHARTMDSLAANLKRIGMEPAAIEVHVTGIVDQYQVELRRALVRLEESPQTASG